LTLTRSQGAITLGVSALIVIAIILIAGLGLFLNATFNTSSTIQLIATTSAPNTSQTTIITHTSTCPPMCPTETGTITQFISLWQALHIAFGGNYSSVPSNTSVSLALYKFWFIGNEASSDVTNILYSNLTGLPLQPVIEPHPDGVIVNITAAVQVGNITSMASPSCEMYMLLWSFQVPSSIPGGGAISVSAVTGKVIYSSPGPIAMDMLNCP
jgi:hypothetical protein